MTRRIAPCAAFLAASCALAAPAHAQDPMRDCMTPDWLTKSDTAFAADCAALAFDGSLQQRQFLAWLFFARLNQLIADDNGGGMSGSGRVPQWMAWATDADTFTCNPGFVYDQTPRDDIIPVTEKKVLAGQIAMHEPDAANEEVGRNQTGYEYIVDSGLMSTHGVMAHIIAGNRVEMPVGSVEIKGSWLAVPERGTAPDGALVFEFASGKYWLRGMHVMAKMKPLPQGENLFFSETPSWFWTTFEFNDNPGVTHVRDTLITQRAPLDPSEVIGILTVAGLGGFGFENYAPNGTQIRYTVDGMGTDPVILGHTDMEDFAGKPNTAQPAYWRNFDASCHTCHATASIHVENGVYFPFTVPTGALTPEYNAPNPDRSQAPLALGNGFEPLDFMWPIAFHAIKGACRPK